MSRTLEKEIEVSVTMKLTETQLKLLHPYLSHIFYETFVKIEHTADIVLVTLHREAGYTAQMYRFTHEKLTNYLNGIKDGIWLEKNR
jgi:hypothetical protein